MNLKEEIQKYKPYNAQEEKDKEIMLKYIETFEDVLTRNNEFGHFTASSWVVNKEKTKVKMYAIESNLPIIICINHGRGQEVMQMVKMIY